MTFCGTAAAQAPLDPQQPALSPPEKETAARAQTAETPAAQGDTTDQEAPSAAPVESALTIQLRQQVDTQQMALREQDAVLQKLQKRMQKAEAALKTQGEQLEQDRRRRREQERRQRAAPKPWYDSVRVSAYVQAQFEHHQDSEDQLAQGGAPLNLDRFLVRRARLILGSEHRFSAFDLELDGNTVNGPSFGIQHAEATVLWRGPGAEVDHAPLLALTGGLFYPPFGRELLASSRKRWFMERSLASRAFFPSEPDVGVRLAGQLGFFNYGIAVVNGEPKGESTGFALRDPNSAKDIVGRFGVAAQVSDTVEASGGVSLLDGRGFFKGTDNTKNAISWSDKDENGSVSTPELNANIGSTGRASQNFKHWALGADARVAVDAGPGRTELAVEAVIASNLDRGMFIADPVSTHFAIREFGVNAAITQEFLRRGVVGFRYDYYDPQGDVFGLKNGALVPVSQAVTTLSPLIGMRIAGESRLVVQYDFIRDHMAIDTVGVPADRSNDVLTVRMQGDL